MRVIYKPKGRALEYSPLALNIYTGCQHSCRYCYVPLALHRDKMSFRTNVRPRKDILKKTERDCMELQDQGNKEKILLCFRMGSDKFGRILFEMILKAFCEIGLVIKARFETNLLNGVLLGF